jgi:hypothetical protein
MGEDRIDTYQKAHAINLDAIVPSWLSGARFASRTRPLTPR